MPCIGVQRSSCMCSAVQKCTGEQALCTTLYLYAQLSLLYAQRSLLYVKHFLQGTFGCFPNVKIDQMIDRWKVLSLGYITDL